MKEMLTACHNTIDTATAVIRKEKEIVEEIDRTMYGQRGVVAIRKPHLDAIKKAENDICNAENTITDLMMEVLTAMGCREDDINILAQSVGWSY